MLTVFLRFCREISGSVSCGWLVCAFAALAMSLPFSANAQFTGKASAIGQYESNTNVFDLATGATAPGTNDTRRSDTYYSYGAEFDAGYQWGRQQFFASASTTQFEYQHFTELDHNGYKLDAGVNWKLGDRWDGKLDFSRTRTMVPFYDLSGSPVTLSLLTEYKDAADIGYKITSNWKIEGSGYIRRADEPVAGSPFLQLTETSSTASIDYLGFTGLTSGLTYNYLSGSFNGSNETLDPSYKQSTLGFVANYQHQRANFEGQIGYSRRTSDTGIDNSSGLTGLLDLRYQWTPKTSVTAKLSRAINSYFLNSGSEIDTEASVGVNWQALYKLAVSAGYTFAYRDFPRQGNNPVGTDRVDIAEAVNIGLSYQPQRWLIIAPYANAQTRRSTFIGGHFSGNIYGVVVTVLTP